MNGLSLCATMMGMGLALWSVGCESDTTDYVPADGGRDPTLGGDARVNAGVDGPAGPGDAARSDATVDAAGSPGSDAGIRDAADAPPADGSLADAGSGDATTSDATVAAALIDVRLANWSSDAPPVDFCLAPHGTNAFEGPLLSSVLLQDAGGTPVVCTPFGRPVVTLVGAGTPGPAFPQVSSYLREPPGRYDVRLVVAGATDCSVGVVPDVTTLLPFDPGLAFTLALTGDVGADAGNPLQLVLYSDDPVGPDGSVALRFIHAASGVSAIDFGTVDHGYFQALFSGVPFRSSAPPSTDGGQLFGYALLAPLANASFSAQMHARTSNDGGTAVQSGVVPSAAAGSVLTIALLSNVPVGGSVQLLACVDNAGTVGAFGCCGVISP